jgi:hypothetical protein
MLEALAVLILVIIGVVLIIVILGYGIYITFYPLTKTIKGGIEAMKAHAAEKKVVDDQDARASTDRVRQARKEDHRGRQKKGPQRKT